MFKSTEKIDFSQLSMTGVRALVFLGLLIESPKTFNEIREYMILYKLMTESNSEDILRIDLATLKAIGCDITRSSVSNGYKYILKKHPFCLRIPEDEVLALKKVYNYIKQDADLDLVMQFDKLFKKIAFYICDDESREAILGISILKYYNTELIEELIDDCINKRIVEIAYKKPTSAVETQRQILAQKVVYKNDKVYLYGHEVDLDKPIVLNLRRIVNILSRRKSDKNFEPSGFKIKFILKEIKQSDLEINEEILEELSEGHLIEGVYHNEFIAAQRVLSFGTRCIVVEPEDFKQKIIQKIKEMRRNYE